jgi:glycosyltransferase involved in cell wall biosynthesis
MSSPFKRMLRVLHVIETMAPHEGGPPRVVAGLVVAQRSMGMDAHILCGDGMQLPEHMHYWQAHAAEFPMENVHSMVPSSNNLPARAMALRGWLRASLSKFDVVHIHQLWRLVPMLSANACRRLSVPYLIAPHTSLSPWALAQKKTKKMIARWLVWDRIFRGAAGFHALNDLEAAEIREFTGPGGAPLFVVPNGVSLAEFSETTVPRASPSVARVFSPTGGNRPFILFFARLHAMKGPDLLLDAFASLALAHPKLQLVFAGPDFGMLDALQRRVAQLRLADRVHFLGLVSGSDRLWLLQNALCLCQPSRDEGFSLSILEAMASKCPVVISEHCKFPEVASHGAGIIAPMSIPALAAALLSYVNDSARRISDGRSGRRLVEGSYTWDIAADKADRMYARVVGRVPKVTTPSCELR